MSTNYITRMFMIQNIIGNFLKIAMCLHQQNYQRLKN